MAVFDLVTREEKEMRCLGRPKRASCCQMYGVGYETLQEMWRVCLRLPPPVPPDC